MANVLILGGSGFLSGAVARLAVAGGHRVWTVTRGRRPPLAGTTPLIADRTDRAGFRQVLEACGQTWDLVADCIGFRADDAAQDVEVLGPRCGRLVFVSTDFVYAPAHRRFPQTEVTDHYHNDTYGGGKRAAEAVLEASGLAWTVLRPGHIYGPGSQLGCLPVHGRDSELLERLRRGEPLRLVGGGHFLQQPIFVDDLATTILGGLTVAAPGIYCVAGPDIVESAEYYRLVAAELGVEARIEELPVADYRALHPEHRSFLCHRFYDLSRLRASGLPIPATPLAEGLRRHVAWKLAQNG